MPAPLTEAERQEIRDLHAEGVSRNEIARRMGRSAGVVSKVVKEAGASFERGDQVKAATQAKAVDNAAKRAQLQSDLLDDAIRLRTQLWEPALVYNFGGKDNTYEEHQLERPDFAGQHTILRAVGVAVDKSVRLAEVDKATAGADEGKSLVGQLFANLAAKALEEHAPDDETDETPDQ